MNTEPALRLDGEEIEDQIIDELLDRALGRGWGVTVFDGEEVCLRRCHDKATIRKAMKSTDTDMLRFIGVDGVQTGCIDLVYGNGEDVIADCTDNGATVAFCDQVMARFEAHHG